MSVANVGRSPENIAFYQFFFVFFSFFVEQLGKTSKGAPKKGPIGGPFDASEALAMLCDCGARLDASPERCAGIDPAKC